MEVEASFRGSTLPKVHVTRDTTVADLLSELKQLALSLLGENVDEPVREIKCIGGKGLRIDRSNQNEPVMVSIGKYSGTAKLRLFIITEKEAHSVALVDERVSKAKGDRRNLLRRRKQEKEKGYAPPSDKFGFQAINVLSELPDAKRAEYILRVLAEDPGVVGCMKEKGYKVGALEELMPDGKVGVDDVCVMGLNVNKGMAIKLRIRTDDLKGWRPLSFVKKVLYHELAHNEISEHTREFFDLTANIRDCCNKHDYRLHGGLTDLAGRTVRQQWQTVVEGGDRPGLWKIDGYDSEDEPEFQEQGLVGGNQRQLSPREAAVEAALSRQLQAENLQVEEADSVAKEDDGGRKSRKKVDDGRRKSTKKEDDGRRKSRVMEEAGTIASVSQTSRRKSSSTADKSQRRSIKRESKQNVAEILPGRQGEVQQRILKLSELKSGVLASRTVLKVVENALSDVDKPESKFFHVKISPGKGLHKVVAKHYGEQVFEACVEILCATGFSIELEMDPTSSDGVKRSLALKRKDPGLLWLAKSFLEELSPTN